MNKNSVDSNNPVSPARSGAISSKVSKTSASKRSSGHKRYAGVSRELSPPLSPLWTTGSLTDQSTHSLALDELHNPGLSMNGLSHSLGEGFRPGTTDFFDLDGPIAICADFPDILSPLDSVQRTFEGFGNPLATAGTTHCSSSDTDTTLPPSPPSNATSINVPTSGAMDNLVPLGDTVAPVVRAGNVRPEVSQRPASESSMSGAPQFGVVSTNPSTQASCQCLTSALLLLETLTVESARPSAPTIARILHFKKRALAQCNMLLDCQHCSSVSSFLMLLVVFCEKMITSYERVLMVLTEQYQLGQGLPIDTTSVFYEQDDARQMTVKDYDLDMEEQPCVFGGLASMQMRKLKTFLARVKAVLRQWNCDMHVVMVDSVEERLRQQLRLFDKDSNEG